MSGGPDICKSRDQARHCPVGGDAAEVWIQGAVGLVGSVGYYASTTGSILGRIIPRICPGVWASGD